MLPQHGGNPKANADPKYTKKVKRESAITFTKIFTVKATLRFAASPCQALSGHLVDTPISLVTLRKRGTRGFPLVSTWKIDLFTLFIYN